MSAPKPTYTRLRPSQKVLADAIDNVRHADGSCFTLVDLTACDALRARLREEQGLRVRTTHLIIKACGLALQRQPWMNEMLAGTRRLDPGLIEIGVSVAGNEAVTPVVKLEDPQAQTLAELVEVFRVKAREARDKEPQDLALVDRILRFLPYPLVRWLIRWAMPKAWLRRATAGTFQISFLNFPGVDLAWPYVLSTTSMLSTGGEGLRPMVVDGAVQAVNSVYVMVHMDHRIIDGKKTVLFLAEVCKILTEETALLDPASPASGAPGT